ncbi:hypothetical protein [uncultured Sphingomonas sp.]|uniref:hypothetical protein n=1 Tax=uncultured Sphingomonas sp. TaxID=158754 RepID=UPI0030F84029
MAIVASHRQSAAAQELVQRAARRHPADDARRLPMPDGTGWKEDLSPCLLTEGGQCTGQRLCADVECAIRDDIQRLSLGYRRTKR